MPSKKKIPTWNRVRYWDMMIYVAKIQRKALINLMEYLYKNELANMNGVEQNWLYFTVTGYFSIAYV